MPLSAMPGGRSHAAVQVRAARLDEAAELSELCLRSKAVWGYDAAFMALAHEALRIGAAQIVAGDVWVATAADGSVAGVVSLGPSDQPGTLDLDKLFIEPRHIRAGFGRILLMHAIGEARRRGAQRLTILADPCAAAFYEQNGARLVGEAPSDAMPAECCRCTRSRWNDDRAPVLAHNIYYGKYGGDISTAGQGSPPSFRQRGGFTATSRPQYP